MAYSKLYCESGPNEMAPLASILWERNNRLLDPVLFFFWDQCFKSTFTGAWYFSWFIRHCLYDTIPGRLLFHWLKDFPSHSQGVNIWHRCCVCLFVVFCLLFFFCFVRVPQKMYLSVSFVLVVDEVVVKAYAIEISSIVEAKLPRYWRVSRIWFMYMRKSRRAALAARLLMQFCTFLCQTATWDFSRSDSFSWNLSRDVSAANSIAVLSCLAYAMVVLWREIGKVTLCALDVQKF